MNPFSPHEAPQEFLILQQVEVCPTSWILWLRTFPQLLKIPELYLFQLVASAVTPIGLSWMAAARSVHPLAVNTEEILKLPPLILHFLVFAIYGQAEVAAIPWSLTQANPWQLNPPLQPQFPYLLPAQSTSCCSERLTVCPLERAQDSRTATALKAQQDPQFPWFLTGETHPLVVQSMSALGTTTTSTSTLLLMLGLLLGLRNMLTNSMSVQAENWLTPILQVWEGSALCLFMTSTLWRQMSLRQASSSIFHSGPNLDFQRMQSSWCLASAEKVTVAAVSKATRTARVVLSMKVLFRTLFFCDLKYPKQLPHIFQTSVEPVKYKKTNLSFVDLQPCLRPSDFSLLSGKYKTDKIQHQFFQKSEEFYLQLVVSCEPAGGVPFANIITNSNTKNRNKKPMEQDKCSKPFSKQVEQLRTKHTIVG